MASSAGFRPRIVPIALSNNDAFELERSLIKLDTTFKREVLNEMNEEKLGGPRYRRPPHRPDLSYKELGELKQKQRTLLSRLEGSAHVPKSHVKIAPNAWAWNLRTLASKLDELSRKLLQSHEMFLCRYAFGLVEAKEEKIERAYIQLDVDSSIVYALWPTESYKPRSSLSADVDISGTIGLTKTLEVIEVPVSGSGNVVWHKEWRWMSAMIKAWGVGGSTAAWEMQRDISAPFAGDRELYLMLQLQRGEKPVNSLASFKANINPKGWARSFEYNNEHTGPIYINYHIA